jgi:cytochrome c oxidase assembly protein subunit 15
MPSDRRPPLVWLARVLPARPPAFRRFAWGVLAYNLLVVLWGALVRATGSGAGCGAHWPLCNGVVVPRAPAVETLIELAHRATSGLSLLLVLALVLSALVAFPARHAARRAALAAGVLILTEAGVGAALVLFRWVAHDTSAARGWVVAIHLLNTFFLLGALALAAAFADRPAGLALRGRGPVAAAFGLAIATLAVSGATGAIAALGDTLYPSLSFVEGLSREFSGAAPLLLRLRTVHPPAAVAAAIVLVAAVRIALRAPSRRARRIGVGLLAVLGAELCAGALNVLLLAPVWLQLVHLALADLAWLGVILLGAEALAPAPRVAGADDARPAAASG